MLKGKSSYRQIIKAESEILTFGKYRNCTIQHVLRTEPSYILWLDDEKIVKFPSEIIFQAEDYELDRRLDFFDGWDPD